MSKKEMLINVVDPAECRIAVIEDGRLEELYVERASSASHVANIYKGRVTNVEPSIQAAFVDFGIGKNGFLHISDLNSSYFPRRGGKVEAETVGHKRPRAMRPPIQACLRRGSEVVVQVIKEGIGTKGPTLSTYLSIPGRYLVIMPGLNRLGVSRKIEDDAARRKLRQTLAELKPPPDLGFIIRTAGMEQPKRSLQRDLAYLVRLWSVIENRIRTQRAPCPIYQESDLIIRTIRDVFNTDMERIIVDNDAAAEKAREFLRIASPRAVDRVLTHTDPIPLFHAYGIESEIEKIFRRQVPLPSGGSLVIDRTEAMVTIDVNSGTFRHHNNAEQTILQTNLEAAREIPRQLRLRDLGGLIVCDFIDMRDGRHARHVEKEFRDGFKNDKARTKVLRMNNFALVAMTRQRMRPDLKGSVHEACPYCNGSGQLKTAESMALEALRLLHLAATHRDTTAIEVAVHPEVAHVLLNRSRKAIGALEQQCDCQIVVTAQKDFGREEVEFQCRDARGSKVGFSPQQAIRTYRPLPSEAARPAALPVAKDLDEALELPEMGPEESLAAEAESMDALPSAPPEAEQEAHADEPAEGQPARPKRRRRRRKKHANTSGQADAAPATAGPSSPKPAAPSSPKPAAHAAGTSATAPQPPAAGAEAGAAANGEARMSRSKRRRLRRKMKKQAAASTGALDSHGDEAQPIGQEPDLFGPPDEPEPPAGDAATLEPVEAAASEPTEIDPAPAEPAAEKPAKPKRPRRRPRKKPAADAPPADE